MNKSLRSWLIACAINVICVLISIRYFDHPIADFLEQHFRHTEGWRFLSLALEPLKIVALAAPLFLFWTGLHRDGKWIKTALVLAWAEVWALATEFVFKQIFGRAWLSPLTFGTIWTAFAGYMLATAGCRFRRDMRLVHSRWLLCSGTRIHAGAGLCLPLQQWFPQRWCFAITIGYLT